MIMSGLAPNTMKKPMAPGGGIAAGLGPAATTSPQTRIGVAGGIGVSVPTAAGLLSKKDRRAARFYGGSNQANWMVNAPEVGDAVRQRVEDAMYSRNADRFEPELERDRASLELRLAQQGFGPESEAYATEMERYNNNANDVRERARESAIMGGGAEQSREFGMGMDVADFALGQNQALVGFSNQARQRSALGNQGIMSGLTNLGSMVAFSDARLKSNIKKVAEHPTGVGVYEYDIFGRREVGVLAQELEKVRPELVSPHPSGFLMVDYSGLEGFA